jgi:hypothetical protein
VVLDLPPKGGRDNGQGKLLASGFSRKIPYCANPKQ